MKKKVLVGLILCTCVGLFVGLSVAQVQKIELTASWEEVFPFKDLAEWVGEEFVFLPVMSSSQKYGYMNFFTNPKKEVYESRISYEDYAGKIAKVVSVIETSGYNIKSLQMWNLTFEVEGKKVYVKNEDESVDDIGYLPDIVTAQRLFVGKTVWYRSTQLVSYDGATEEFSHTTLKKWSPVEIVGVEPEASYEIGNAIVLLRSTEGEHGFAAVVLSGTNVAEGLRKNNQFLDKFLLEDPRVTHNWSRAVWNTIERESVSIGMSKEQVRMSWGEPEDVNSTTTALGRTEQWVYPGSKYLYFRDGKLTTIQL